MGGSGYEYTHVQVYGSNIMPEAVGFGFIIAKEDKLGNKNASSQSH